MTKNLGTTERLIRLAAGLTGALAAFGFLEAPFNWLTAAGLAGFAATALIGWCPFWAVLGITSKKTCSIGTRG